MNNAFLFALLAKRRAENKGVVDSSEKNKIMMYPLIMKDPFSALLTSDIATEKAVQTTTVETVSREKQDLNAEVGEIRTVVNMLTTDLSGIKEQLEKDAANHGNGDVKNYCTELLKKPSFQVLEIKHPEEKNVDVEYIKQTMKKRHLIANEVPTK